MSLAVVSLVLAQAAALPAGAEHVPAAPLISPQCRRADRGADGITVCGRRDTAQGYRLPPPERFDPAGPIDSVSRERHRLFDVGAAGIGSCSTVGPGGWTGCMLEDWRHEDEQYAGRNHGHGPGASIQVGPFRRALPR